MGGGRCRSQLHNVLLLRAALLFHPDPTACARYGTGNMSSRKRSLLDALRSAIAKGIVIVAVSQCAKGSVDLKAYALGRQLEEIGVIGAGDATTEAVVAKLAFLLSWPDSAGAQVRHYMQHSLRGEVTEGHALRAGGGAGSAGGPAVGGERGEIFLSMDDIGRAAGMSHGRLRTGDGGEGDAFASPRRPGSPPGHGGIAGGRGVDTAGASSVLRTLLRGGNGAGVA